MKSSKKFNIILLGISGSGKGTQAKKIIEDYSVIHISLGQVFRREIAKKTLLSKKISQFVDTGRLVPNETTCKILFPEILKTVSRGFVLEGFPRFSSQPGLLDAFLTREKLKIDLVISIIVRPEVVLERREKMLSSGKKFQSGRTDDNLSAIKERFDFYIESIKPILRYYREKGILVEIDGERPIDDIYKDIVLELEKI